MRPVSHPIHVLLLQPRKKRKSPSSKDNFDGALFLICTKEGSQQTLLYTRNIVQEGPIILFNNIYLHKKNWN